MNAEAEKEREAIFKFITHNVQKHFDTKLIDLSKRVRLEATLDKWRPEIEEVWDQKVGNKARQYSVYFDNEYVCNISADDKPAIIDHAFLKGFTELYESDTICIELHEYKIRDEIRKIAEEKQEKEDKKKLEDSIKNESPEVRKIITELDATAK